MCGKNSSDSIPQRCLWISRPAGLASTARIATEAGKGYLCRSIFFTSCYSSTDSESELLRRTKPIEHGVKELGKG